MGRGRRFDAAALRAAKVVAGGLVAGALAVACTSSGSDKSFIPSNSTRSTAPGGTHASAGTTLLGPFNTEPGQTTVAGQGTATTAGPGGATATTGAPGGSATTVAGATTAPSTSGAGTTSPPTTRTTQTSLVF